MKRVPVAGNLQSIAQSFRNCLIADPEIIQRFLGPTFFAFRAPRLQYSLSVASVTSPLRSAAASLAVYQPFDFSPTATQLYRTAG